MLVRLSTLHQPMGLYDTSELFRVCGTGPEGHRSPWAFEELESLLELSLNNT